MNIIRDYKFKDGYFSVNESIILFRGMKRKNLHSIKYWDFGPENCMDGFQSKLEGKYTRRLRRWFLDEFGIVLPQAGPWGEIDACHDPHNQTTSVFCAYQ